MDTGSRSGGGGGGGGWKGRKMATSGCGRSFVAAVMRFSRQRSFNVEQQRPHRRVRFFARVVAHEPRPQLAESDDGSRAH